MEIVNTKEIVNIMEAITVSYEKAVNIAQLHEMAI
jgi:hypothetical protein